MPSNSSSKINVKSFIDKNIKPYNGDEKFLKGPSEKTTKVWNKCKELLKQETKNGGVLDIDTDTVSGIDSYAPGYIDKESEVIVGLQTDQPLKRAIKPYGGIRVVMKACEENGRKVNPAVVDIFMKYRKSHNDAVFSVYTEQMRNLRRTGLLTGLPDAYARGRIIGDYRRVALYGIDKLIEEKTYDRTLLEEEMTEEVIRLREEVADQISALQAMKTMAKQYGFDISKPAQNAKEAVQWLYFGYLAALKEQDGAAMSLGNASSFLDIFIENDIAAGKLTEEEAQELIDQFVIKLRLVRHLRMSEYNQLFAGDPTWLTESIGGMLFDGRTKVTKTSYRFLNTLYNLGPSPEPNMTIMWSEFLPDNFKKFTAKVSIDTSSIQYENEDLMNACSGSDDNGISCCVSRLSIGKEMQYFGARCNIAKALLLAINEGKDENAGIKIIDGIPKLKSDVLDYAEVMKNYKKVLKVLAKDYVDTMNVIHYMHDKYYYEKAQMSLLDSDVRRLMAFGAAGLSVVADSLSAIKFAEVRVIRNADGIATGFETKGEFPKYGNDDNKVDKLAAEIVERLYNELKSNKIYRNATPTLSILTITSNVVYGKKTGATPDGRKAGEPFAPGANPMHGRDSHGAIASLNSVAKISYENALDGVSNTFSIVPSTLGSTKEDQVANLVDLLSGYFSKKAHHLNVNVMNKEILLKAIEHPEEYPQLTIRVSGYAVNFVKLSREQQNEVLARTFFESM